MEKVDKKNAHITDVDGRTIIANLLLVTNTWKNDVMYDDIRRYGHPWRVAW